jgi:hypothetical protein
MIKEYERDAAARVAWEEVYSAKPNFSRTYRPCPLYVAMKRIRTPIYSTFSNKDTPLHALFHLAARRKEDRKTHGSALLRGIKSTKSSLEMVVSGPSPFIAYATSARRGAGFCTELHPSLFVLKVAMHLAFALVGNAVRA